MYELGNALSKHPAFSPDNSLRTFQSFLDVGLKLRSFTEPKLLGTSFEVSKELQITFYDAAYIALSKVSGATFITADSPLFGKVKRYCDAKLLVNLTPKELAA